MRYDDNVDDGGNVWNIEEGDCVDIQGICSAPVYILRRIDVAYSLEYTF